MLSTATVHTSDNGLAFVEAHEGVVLRAYRDAVGVLTIGCGHTSAAGFPQVVAGLTISRLEAMEMLRRDILQYEAAVSSAIGKLQPSQHQADAMVSLAYNIGPQAFRDSSVARCFRAGDLEGAADAFGRWVRAGGHVLTGLVHRRADEETLFATGSYGLAARLGDEFTGVMLVKGSHYPDAVRAFQRDLQQLGIALADDGDFGPRTDKAVRDFQASHHLTPDGRVGPATRAAIADALRTAGKAPTVAMLPLPGVPVLELAA